MTIVVTHSDILLGERAHCEKCPIALAIRRALQKPVWVHELLVVDENGRTIAVLPHKVTHWMNQFDYFGSGKPFKFTLEMEVTPACCGLPMIRIGQRTDLEVWKCEKCGRSV